ncbi:membrane protein [Luteimicrobium album]|uniref:Membrane protein n=1 Tax=Luteimicrobium album TaxID=1054550 RepID=A0ABQ6I5N3_9MICO|nr:anthrone oxygenase family protein [Luteimicrobium album]GMA25962.1 membrane protein [Luteimicrobium album]
MRPLTAVLTGLTVLSAGAMAGTFFAFAVGVMPGLSAGSPATAVSAMRHINARIENPFFLAVFMLVPVFAAVAGVLALRSGQRTAGVLLLVAAAVYVVGTIITTGAVNVPLNQTLASASPHADPATVWADFVGRWNVGNTVRTLASSATLLLAAAAFAARSATPKAAAAAELVTDAVTAVAR